jgi:hypothetical protein
MKKKPLFLVHIPIPGSTSTKFSNFIFVNSHLADDDKMYQTRPESVYKSELQ